MQRMLDSFASIFDQIFGFIKAICDVCREIDAESDAEQQRHRRDRIQFSAEQRQRANHPGVDAQHRKNDDKSAKNAGTENENDHFHHQNRFAQSQRSYLRDRFQLVDEHRLVLVDCHIKFRKICGDSAPNFKIFRLFFPFLRVLNSD